MKKTNILKNHKAVILAGGKGTRFYPITKEISKPLLPVKKKPIINYLVDLFFSEGIREIAILIDKKFVEDFNWWKKRYYPAKHNIKFFIEKKPLGTFGGLYLLKNWVMNNDFFLTDGDELKKLNLKKMLSFHRKMNAIITVATVSVQNPKDYGVAICKKGLIEQFLEKPKNPPSKYINSGLYLLSPKIFDYHPGPKFTMIETDILPKLAKEKKLAGFKFSGKWMDCGNLSKWEKAIMNWK